jgi:hypothetical protein
MMGQLRHDAIVKWVCVTTFPVCSSDQVFCEYGHKFSCLVNDDSLCHVFGLVQHMRYVGMAMRPVGFRSLSGFAPDGHRCGASFPPADHHKPDLGIFR